MVTPAATAVGVVALLVSTAPRPAAIATGAVVVGPAPRPLPPKQITVTGDAITLT